eukprot:scpid38322/ scgid21593/ 
MSQGASESAFALGTAASAMDANCNTQQHTSPAQINGTSGDAMEQVQGVLFEAAKYYRVALDYRKSVSWSERSIVWLSGGSHYLCLSLHALALPVFGPLCFSTPAMQCPSLFIHSSSPTGPRHLDTEYETDSTPELRSSSPR